MVRPKKQMLGPFFFPTKPLHTLRPLPRRTANQLPLQPRRLVNLLPLYPRRHANQLHVHNHYRTTTCPHHSTGPKLQFRLRQPQRQPRRPRRPRPSQSRQPRRPRHRLLWRLDLSTPLELFVQTTLESWLGSISFLDSQNIFLKFLR